MGTNWRVARLNIRRKSPHRGFLSTEFLRALASIFLFAASTSSLLARDPGDFSDLHEHDTKVYGSEKEEKFPVNAIVYEREKWTDHDAVQILFLYGRTDYPRYRSVRLLPFYYHIESKIDNRLRTFVLPFYFYQRDGSTEKTVTPLSYRFKNDWEDFRLYGWLFMRWQWDTKDHTALFPFFYKGKDTWDDSSYLAVLPLFLWESRKEGKHLNVVGLFDLSTDKHGLESLWFLPILFYGRESSENHRGNKELSQLDRHNDTYLHIFPLFFSRWHSHENAKGENAAVDQWIFAWLFYRSKWTEYCNPGTNGSATLLLNTYWRTETRDSTETVEEASRFVFFPLLYVDWGKTAYKRLDDEGTRKTVVSPLFYYDSEDRPAPLINVPDNRRSEVTLFFPIIPLFYYNHTKDSQGSTGFSVSPIHYASWEPGKEHFWLALYYHSHVDKGDEDVRHFVPFYFSWRSPEENGTILLPLFITYEDKNNYFHANLSGFALRKATGGFAPTLAEKEGSYYLDWEFSWLYNMFSVSTRTPIYIPKASKDAQVSLADVEKAGAEHKTKGAVEPTLSKRSGSSREDSVSYFGLNLFYGILAVEFADTKRHFRLLPLSWFTWDARSDDHVYFVPPFFFRYRDGDLEYNVFFPVYASQREGKSYTEAYGLFLFIRSYDAAEDRTEYSFIWPLSNFHSSPTAGGGRIIPFLWYKREVVDGLTTRKLLTPLFYHENTESSSPPTEVMQETRRTSSTLSWLSYHEHEEFEQENRATKTATKNQSTFFFAPLLPLYMYSSTASQGTQPGQPATANTDSYWYLFPVVYASSTSSSRADATSASRTMFSPFFYYSTRENTDKEQRTSNKETVFAFPIIPLFYHHSRTATDAEGRAHSDTHTNVGWLVDWETKENTVQSFWVFPFFMWRKSDYVWAFPFYYSNDTERAFHIVPIFWSWKAADRLTLFIAGLYLHWSPYGNTQNFLFLIERSRQGDHLSLNMLFRAIHFDTSPSEMHFRLLYRILFGVEYKSPTDYNWNFLWMITIRNGDNFHSSFLPFWWYSSSPDHTRLILPPLLSYFDYEGANRFEMVGLGLIWYRNYDAQTRTNTELALLGTVYEGLDRPERGWHSVGSMWGFLWQKQNEDETGYRKLSILKGLLFSRTENKGTTRYRVLGIPFGDDDPEE